MNLPLLKKWSEAELKTLVIRMCNKLRERMDELSENFNKKRENIKVEIESSKKIRNEEYNN